MSPFVTSLFSVRGRTSRRRYVYLLLGYIVLSLVVLWLGRLLMGLQATMGMLITLVVLVPMMAAMYCQCVRRYHDFGVTGWVPGGFLLAAFVFNVVFPPLPPVPPAVAATAWADTVRIVLQAVSIVLYVFVPGLMPATKGSNRYGEASTDRQ